MVYVLGCFWDDLCDLQPQTKTCKPYRVKNINTKYKFQHLNKIKTTTNMNEDHGKIVFSSRSIN